VAKSVEAFCATRNSRNWPIFEGSTRQKKALRDFHHGLLREEDGRWGATIAHNDSCPNCERVITLEPSAKAGDIGECCSRRYRLTFEYGAFSVAEP